MSDCNAVQFSDQMACSCGNVWDMNDPYPPECKKEPAMLAAAPAVKGEPVAYASHGVNHILAERMAKHNKETGNAND